MLCMLLTRVLSCRRVRMRQAEAAAAAGQVGQADGIITAEAAAMASPGASDCRAAAECRALLLRLVERYDKQVCSCPVSSTCLGT